MSKKVRKKDRVTSTPMGLTAWQIYVIDEIGRRRSAELQWPVSRSETLRFLIDESAKSQDITEDAAYEKWLRDNGFLDD